MVVNGKDPTMTSTITTPLLSNRRARRPMRTSKFSHVFATLADDCGAATAEYAVATMAAVGFAGLLVVILRGDEVRGFLTDLVRKALSVE